MAGKHRDGKHVRNVKRMLGDLARQNGVEVSTGVGDPHYWYEVRLGDDKRRCPFTKNPSNEVGQIACIRREFVNKVRELKREISK